MRSIPVILERFCVPGMAFAITDDMRILDSAAWGTRGAGEPVTARTVFEAASLSKPLFAYRALRLITKGLLDLDRPLNEYLPAPYLPGEPLSGKITARMILTHRSGLCSWRAGGPLQNSPITVEFEPGTRYGYSGEGFTYLQHVVEVLTGQSFDDMMAELAHELGMENTSSWMTRELARDRALWHDEEGLPIGNRFSFYRGNSAYSLYTTATDYARFLIEMMRPDPAHAEMIRLQVPQDSDPFARRALAWIVRDDGWIEHGGRNTGFCSIARFHPLKKIGVVILTNGNNGEALYRELLNTLGLRA